MPDDQALVEPGRRQQESRDELRRPRRVDDDLATRYATGAVDGERQPIAVYGHAEASQCVEDGGLRPYAGVRVAVEPHRAGGERRHRREEPHDGARQTAIDVGAAQRTGASETVVASAGSTRIPTPSASSAPSMRSVSRLRRVP